MWHETPAPHGPLGDDERPAVRHLLANARRLQVEYAGLAPYEAVARTVAAFAAR